MTRQDAEVAMLRAEVERLTAERGAMAVALSSVRKAAGSGRYMTNRLQFIYARSGAAIDGLPWDDSWKAEHGYTMRDRTLRENDLLRAEVERLRADAERYRYLRNIERRSCLAKTGPDAGVWCDCEDAAGNLTLLTEGELDAAIDAARAALGADHAD